MFETHFGIEEINAYNSNLNDRLARKDKKYLNREQQLDIVIVVDRLLTGFDGESPSISSGVRAKFRIALSEIANDFFTSSQSSGNRIPFAPTRVQHKGIINSTFEL